MDKPSKGWEYDFDVEFEVSQRTDFPQIMGYNAPVEALKKFIAQQITLAQRQAVGAFAEKLISKASSYKSPIDTGSLIKAISVELITQLLESDSK